MGILFAVEAHGRPMFATTDPGEGVRGKTPRL